MALELKTSGGGRADLESARADGYHRDTWRYIEKVLGKYNLTECRLCHAPNLIHRWKPKAECKRCGAELSLAREL